MSGLVRNPCVSTKLYVSAVADLVFLINISIRSCVIIMGWLCIRLIHYNEKRNERKTSSVVEKSQNRVMMMHGYIIGRYIQIKCFEQLIQLSGNSTDRLVLCAHLNCIF